MPVPTIPEPRAYVYKTMCMTSYPDLWDKPAKMGRFGCIPVRSGS